MKKTSQMQVRILNLSWIEIPSLVGNFELKTLSQGGELWTEILSQGLGSLKPNFRFWSKSPPYPMVPPQSGMKLIAP